MKGFEIFRGFWLDYILRIIRIGFFEVECSVFVLEVIRRFYVRFRVEVWLGLLGNNLEIGVGGEVT